MSLLLALLSAAASAPAPGDRPLAPLAMMPTPAAAAPATTPRPTREQILAAVTAEWSRYDTRRTSRLDPLEFSTWVMQANGVAVAPAGAKKASGVKPIEALNAAARAFAAADANHDGGVTPEEMTAFLMR